MKKSGILLAAIICMMMQTVSASAQDRFISIEQLPQTIEAFIQKHFPGQVIDYANIDSEFADTDFDDDFDDAFDDNFDNTTYEVCLNNGIELDFDMNGNWKKVDCYYMTVPNQIIPTPIAQYVDTHFDGHDIVKIDKKHYGYEIELSNGVEVKFNHQGELISIDD